jgi:hypothetical protein
MNTDPYTFLTIISLLLALGAIVGNILAYMKSSKGQIQERAINAMEKELDLLHSRIDDMERENQRLEQIIATICEALQKRGLHVSVEGHIVTVTDGNVTQSVRIQGGE